MKRTLVFKVEKKIGTLPDIYYQCVFEREVIADDVTSKVWFHIHDIIQTLCLIFPEHRVLVICE